MPAPKWTTPEQLAFLTEEDKKWAVIKAGTGSLKSFYVRTTNTFLEKWPASPKAEHLEKAHGDAEKAKQFAEDEMLARVKNWFGNRHKSSASSPSVSEPILDLSGKHSRKKPPLQKWQAFSVIYHRPKGSPLRDQVQSLFEQRNDPAAVGFLSDFLPPNVDISTIDHLTFLSAYMRERCTRLSAEEEQKVDAYIERQEALAAEERHRPWFLESDCEDEPLSTENKYIQARIDELPRVAQRALDEIEKATGFKGLLIVGGLTPASDGMITTQVYMTGAATTTGLTFMQSWGGYRDLHTSFVNWLQLAYDQEEKRRRGVPSNGPPAGTTPTKADELANSTESGAINESPPPSESRTPDESTTPTTSDPRSQVPQVLPPTIVTPIPDAALSPATEGGTSPPMMHSPASSNAPLLETPSLATPTPPPNFGPPVPQPVPSIAPPAAETQVIQFEHNPSYPDFITTGVIEFLNSVDGGQRWVEMVESYLELERNYPSRPVGRLSLRSRPQEVVNWGHQRDLIPSIANIQQFQEQWITWWGSCQPKWRHVVTWPFPCGDAKEKDWARLNVSGPHGLFAVVMSTSWWAASPGLDSHRAAFDAAVTDLRWVMEHLAFFSASKPASQLDVNKGPANKFPGHCERAPGKRQVKPSLKVCGKY